MKPIFLILLWGILIAATADGASVTYTYDSLNRLTSAAYSDGSGESYVYDPSGNRVSRNIFVPSPKRILDVKSLNGSVSRNIDLPSYPSGSQVILSALPNPGFLFIRWEGDVNDNSNPIAITMDGNKSVTAIYARSASPDFNEFLRFDDNQLPPQWNLVLNAGTNSGLFNQRFEVGPQGGLDTRARIEVAKSMPINATGVQISYSGNLANIYDGMGSQIHLIMTNGGDFFCSMNKAMYGVKTLEVIVRGPGGTSVHDILPGQFGTFTATATFKNNQVRYLVVNQSDNSVTFDRTVFVPGLDPHQMEKIWLTAFTTPGEVAWMDDVNIRFIFPQLTPVSNPGHQFQFLLNGVEGNSYVIQVSTNLVDWTSLTTNRIPVECSTVITESITTNQFQRFYRALPFVTRISVPAGMNLIPAGNFTMGDSFAEARGDDLNEMPTHRVNVGPIFMDRYEVTKTQWDEVYNWAIVHGYSFDNPGLGKAPSHPVHTVSWFDSVKWCNARSEMEGRVPAYYTGTSQTSVFRTGRVDVQNDWVNWNTGYRLPTEAEWEKAARGGLEGKRFPWGDSISQDQANYDSTGSFAYNLSPLVEFHPAYNVGAFPYTSPVGSFAPNGYGLYDMAGNVYQWCWDRSGIYESALQDDPHGPLSGDFRVVHGGVWSNPPNNCRVAYRGYNLPTIRDHGVGLRCVMSAGQTYVTLVSWGSNLYGQATIPTGLGAVQEVAAGYRHTVVLKKDGSVRAWGDNGYGQTNVPGELSGVTAVAAGYWHTIVLKNDGTVQAWGFNQYGQSSVPVGLNGVIAIAGGANHTLALKSDGTVVAWGENNFGQTTVPSGLSGVIAIAGGNSYSVALKSDGTLVAWGENVYGKATPPPGLTGVRAIAADGSHTMALKNDGTVVAWGDNTNGQTTVPVGLSGVVGIATGNYYTVALKSDGTVVAWGDNTSGKAIVPTGLSGVTSIAAGADHAVALVKYTLAP